MIRTTSIVVFCVVVLVLLYKSGAKSNRTTIVEGDKTIQGANISLPELQLEQLKNAKYQAPLYNSTNAPTNRGGPSNWAPYLLALPSNYADTKVKSPNEARAIILMAPSAYNTPENKLDSWSAPVINTTQGPGLQGAGDPRTQSSGRQFERPVLISPNSGSGINVTNPALGDSCHCGCDPSSGGAVAGSIAAINSIAAQYQGVAANMRINFVSMGYGTI